MTLSKFIILLSFLLEVALMAIAYLAAIGATTRDDMPDFETTWIAVLGTLSLAFIFCLNIAFAFIRNARKIGHLVIVLSSIMAFILMIRAVRHFESDRRYHFLNGGSLKYELLVDAIVKGDTNQFTDLPPLGRFTDFKFEGSHGVDAETDSDGAIRIMFLGRDHDPFSGYLYYNGRKMVAKEPHSNFFRFTNDLNPEFYFLLLTNNWYEYAGPSGL